MGCWRQGKGYKIKGIIEKERKGGLLQLEDDYRNVCVGGGGEVE